MTDTERDEIRMAKPDHDTRDREGGMMDHLDDDENVKMMRETARIIGLTELLVKASQSTNSGATKELVRKALRLLGEEDI